MQEISNILGMEQHEFVYELSQDLDPIQAFNTFLSEVGEEDLLRFEEEWEAIRQQLETRNATLQERLSTVDRWTEIQPERDTIRPDSYYPELKRDAANIRGTQDITEWVNTQESRSSREIRARIDNAYLKSLSHDERAKRYHKKIMLEYGTFDIAITESTHKAWLQVRRDLYHNTLKVGMILINMSNGEAHCKVYRCDHKFQLSSKSPSPTIQDREWQEYQVLRIFEHLGTHNNPAWPKFTQHTNPNRDTPQEKLASRSSVVALRGASRCVVS